MTNRDDLNRQAYDALADEYEERVESLRPVTEEAMEYFASHLLPGGKVLDVGCGVGLAMNTLTGRGFVAAGIDISPKMTAYAQQRNPSSLLLTGDFLTAELPTDFDGVLAFAYIHLYPAEQIPAVFARIRSLLKPGGLAFLSSTESVESKEGWYVKEDYGRQERRFRKFWTEAELRAAITVAGFEVVDLMKYRDPYGKVWMDFIARKPL